MAHIVCANLLEVVWVQAVVNRLSELVDGRKLPYTTPLRPEDRVGYQDGSTVEVKRLTRPVRLADGTIAVGLGPVVRRLLEQAQTRTAAELGTNATRRTRLLALLAAKRDLAENEIADDQSGLEE